MQELRKSGDKKVLAVLSEEQVASYEKMKGAPFKMPERSFGGRGGGGRGGSGRPGRPGGGDRPQRPGRPGN